MSKRLEDTARNGGSGGQGRGVVTVMVTEADGGRLVLHEATVSSGSALSLMSDARRLDEASTRSAIKSWVGGGMIREQVQDLGAELYRV